MSFQLAFKTGSGGVDQLLRDITGALVGVGRTPLPFPILPPGSSIDAPSLIGLIPGVSIPAPDQIRVDLGQLPRIDIPAVLPALDGITGGLFRSPLLQPIFDGFVRIIRPPAEEPVAPTQPPMPLPTDPESANPIAPVDPLPTEPPIRLPVLIEEAEPNDSASEATDIRLGMDVRAALKTHADVDWFDLGDLPAGMVQISFKTPGDMLGLIDTFSVTLVDADGQTINKFVTGRASVFTLKLDQPVSGAHVSIRSASDWLIDSRDYGFRVDHRPLVDLPPPMPNQEVERNDTPEEANPLAMGDFVMGRLDSRIDQDWFVTEADRAGSVRLALDLKASNRWLDLLMVEVRDESGAVLARAAARSNLMLEVKADAGDRLFVGLSSVGLLSDQTAYRLKVVMPEVAPAPSPTDPDAIVGTARADRLIGTPADDVFDGRGGDDTLEGGEGTDIALFNAALEDLSVAQYGSLSVVRGGFAAGPHAGSAARLIGVETLRAADGDLPLGPSIVDPVPGEAAPGDADPAVAIESPIDRVPPSIMPPSIRQPSLYPDLVLGTRRAERLVGGDGDDLIDGAGGADTVLGGAGTDTFAFLAPESAFSFQSLEGVTRIRGLEGSFEYAGHRVVAVGVESLAFADGGDPVALASSGGRAVRLGTAGSDVLRGDDSDEVFDGLGGSDLIDGGAGSDTLVLFAPRSAFAISQMDASRPEFLIRAVGADAGEYARQTSIARNIERVVFADGETVLAAPPRLVLSSSATQLTEGGDPLTVQVALSAAPSSDMILSVRFGADLLVEATTIVFTPDDWNQARTLTVSAVDDVLIEPVEKALVEFTVSTSSADTLTPVRAQALNFTVYDNDTPQMGAISGRLWHDADRDGLAAEDEPGLAGWAVFIDQNGDGVLSQGDIQTRSDLDGDWRIDGLEAGQYLVQAVVRSGWQPTSEAVASDGATLVDDDGGGGRILSLDYQAAPIDEAAAMALSTHLGHATRLGEFRSDPRFAGVDGSGTAIVIIDTGIDLDHAAFGPDADGNGVADRIVYYQDFSGAGDSDASDPNGHGTHVAGIAAGQGEYAGVAPGADIIVLKVLDENGAGRSFDLREAVDWVVQNVEQYNIVAVNLSLGFGDFDTEATTGFLSSPFKALAENGVTVVAASGNGYARNPVQGVSYPSSDPWAMSVGAVWATDGTLGSPMQTGTIDDLAAFSQRDDTESDIFAPGVQIQSAWLDGAYRMLSGTSMATPQVTGMVALAQQIAFEQLGRRLTVAEIRSLIASTADMIVDDPATQGDGSLPNTGLSFGRINMLALAEAILDRPPPVSQTVTVLAGETTGDVDFGFLPLQSPEGQALDDLIVGTAWGERLYGAGGSDRLFGGAGDDTVMGGDGDDWLAPGAGHDLVDGGAGIDTVTFIGARSAYQVESFGSGPVRVESLLDGSVDRLIDVEFLAFDDVILAADGLTVAETDPAEAVTDSRLTAILGADLDPALESELQLFADTPVAGSPALTLDQIKQMFSIRTVFDNGAPSLEVWVKGERQVTSAALDVEFDAADAVFIEGGATGPAGWGTPIALGLAEGGGLTALLLSSSTTIGVGSVEGQRLGAFKLNPLTGATSISDIRVVLSNFDDIENWAYGIPNAGSGITSPITIADSLSMPAQFIASIVPVTTAALTEGTGSNAGAYEFDVQLNSAATTSQTIQWSVLAGSSGAGSAGAADFAGGVFPGGTLTFAPGETSKRVSIAVAGDTTHEGDETFQLALTATGTGAPQVPVSPLSVQINDDDPEPAATLSGMVYHWKSHALLGGVVIEAVGQGLNETHLATDKIIQLGSARLNGLGQIVSDVFVTPDLTNEVNFDLSIRLRSGTVQSFTPVPQGDVQHSLERDGLDINGSIAASTAPRTKIGELVFSPGNGVLADVSGVVGSESVDPFDYGVSLTESSGQYSIPGLRYDDYEISAWRGTIDLGRNGVKADDATAAFMIATRLNPNGTGIAISPYQVFAADTTYSNSIAADDATGAFLVASKVNPTSWKFFDETIDFWTDSGSLALSLRGYPAPSKPVVQVSGDSELNFSGLIVGDVDGSWTPAGAFTPVPREHFSNLATLIGARTEQWGFQI